MALTDSFVSPTDPFLSLLCPLSDGVDLYLQQFLVPRGVLYSGRPNPLHLSLRVQLHGTSTVKPDPDRAVQVYTIRLYLSRDTKLDPEGIDTEVRVLYEDGKCKVNLKNIRLF